MFELITATMFPLIPVAFCPRVSLREEAISTFSTSSRSVEMLHMLQILRPWNQHQNSFLSTDPTAALELFTSTNMTVRRANCSCVIYRPAERETEKPAGGEGFW